jgi:hypothetical protein
LLGLVLCGPLASASSLKVHYIAGHYVAASPRPEVLPGGEAWQMARQLATANPGAFVVRGLGRSMQPLYPSGTLLVVQPVPFAALQRGMTVMFRHGANHTITHVLVAKTADGWRTAGLNNRRDDYFCVNSGNIAGVVIAAFTEVEHRLIALR